MWKCSPVFSRIYATSSFAWRSSPALAAPEGRSPRSATTWSMPLARYSSRVAATSARVAPMQEMCGAAGCPADWISSTVSSVRSRVEPPAPYVHEKNLGFSCASCFQVERSFSMPSGVLGGKNSKLKARGCFLWDSMSALVGEVGREPALGLLEGERLAARVIGGLVLADLVDR